MKFFVFISGLLVLGLTGCNFLQIKSIEPVPIPPEIMDEDIFWQDYEDQFTDDFYDEDIADVGDLNFYSLELGRNDSDILSRRTYTFYLPVDIDYELQGVDASSGLILFKKGNETVFEMITYDYLRNEDEINKYWPNSDEYSFVGGHTNILELEDKNFEDEMYIFADTLEIDGKNAF